MDNFEKYFKENRLLLDTDNLDSQCWNNIQDTFRNNNRKRWLRRSYVAASLLAIIILSITLYRSQVGQDNVSLQHGIFNEAHADLAKQETDYMQLINSKLNDIKKQKVPEQYKDMFDGFVEQLKIIDKQYDVYKSVVEKHGYNEEIIQQIIFNYQLKLSALQMLQSEMTKINNLSKSDRHDNKKIQLDI